MRSRLLPLFGLLCVLAWSCGDAAARPRDFRGRSFTLADYVTATYYFYWHDTRTGAHIVNGNGSDALTDHPDYSTPAPLVSGGYAARPPAVFHEPPEFSFQDPGWHARELRRMTAVGIDLALPVYWGVPGVEDWSNAGLVQLGRAMDSLDAERQAYPAVGLFYDTTTLSGIDLSAPAGKAQFYGTIRDFYSRVRPRRWARFQDRALVWLYSSAWPARIDAAALREASERFAAEFGGVRLFYVGDPGWRAAGAPIDLLYSWGAAAPGPIIRDVASVGPGYNDSAVIDRPQHLIVPRENGAFYVNGWEAVHGSGRRVVAVETWNEFHEATEVAPSFEHGTTYWSITRRETARHRFPGVFVRQAHRYFTRRDVDAGTFLDLTNAMGSGTLPSAVRDTLQDSAPARRRTSNRAFVNAVYRRYLGRRPRRQELAQTLAEIRQGTRRSEIRDRLLDSDPARAAVSNAAFVTQAYRQFLLREPEAAGFNHWMGLLARGTPRHIVRDGFVNSLEIKWRDLAGMTARERASVFDFAGR